MYPVITISREFGSGGHTIGMKVAETLGIPFYDSNIVDRVAEESGYAKEYVKTQGEFASRMDRIFNANAYFGTPQDPQTRIFAAQRKVILEVAHQGPCVIVGRCADSVLSEEEMHVMNVFIHADFDYRCRRVLERHGETEIPVEKRILQKDKGRRSYYAFFTDRVWGDFNNYDISLNTASIGIDGCAEIIASLARKMDR